MRIWYLYYCVRIFNSDRLPMGAGRGRMLRPPGAPATTRMRNICIIWLSVWIIGRDDLAHFGLCRLIYRVGDAGFCFIPIYFTVTDLQYARITRYVTQIYVQVFK